MRVLTKRDLVFLAYAAAILGWRLVPRSMRLQRCTSVAAQLGALWYRLDHRGAVLARQNLQGLLAHRLSPAQVDATALALFQGVALRVLLQDMVPSLTLEELRQFLTIEGEEHLDRGLSRGKGVIFLGTHCGLPGYAPPALLERLGYEVKAVLGEEVETDDSWLYRRVILPIRRRSRLYWQVIEPTGRPQRTMAECLRQNQVLMILGDTLDEDLSFLRMPPPYLLPAPLLGHTVPLRTGPFRLARWLDAPVVPFFTVPRPGGGFALVVEPPLALSADGSIRGLMADLAAFTARFEPYLIRHPATWLHWRHGRLLELMRPAAGECGPDDRPTPSGTCEVRTDRITAHANSHTPAGVPGVPGLL